MLDTASVEFEQLCYRESETTCDPIQGLERGSVPPAFDKAEEIYRHAEHLGKALLTRFPTESNVT
jgi:hypothetical protein